MASSSRVRAVSTAERSEATRAALVDAARHLFVQKGYFATGTEEIVAAAGVGTRGALYHHFGSKKDLFLAVFVEVEQELHAAAPRDDGATDALRLLSKGLRGYLKTSSTRDVQRILLTDGPAVLGWKQWREMQVQHGLGAIRRLLEKASSDGVLDTRPIDILANVLLAATDEAALYVANADDPQSAGTAAADIIERLIEGMRVD